MNDLRIFATAEFGQIRTVEILNQPYFVANDVAVALGYKRPADAIAQHCKGSVKRRYLTAGGEQEIKVIPESDVYRLVIKSKLPGAERFEAWIMEEVLPSIRKTGGYITGQETMSDSELIAKALIVAQRQIEERNKQIAQMQPKALFADAVAASHSSILIGDLAKLICQNGVEIGQKRLFAWMRDHGYLIKAGESRNMPMQRYVEQGLFEIKESNVCNPDGSIRITKTTKVTGKGQVYFVNKFVNC